MSDEGLEDEDRETPTKEMVLTTIEDLVSDFLYYDRKDDSSLLRGDIEMLVEQGEISIDEMVAEFRSKLEEVLG